MRLISQGLKVVISRLRASFWSIVPGTLCVVTLAFALADRLPAGFSSDVASVLVEIEGVNYGRFDFIAGLDDSTSSLIQEGDRKYYRIDLRRDFVTDPSLYLWAKNETRERSARKDVQLVLLNSDGGEIDRYTLKMTQPISWSVESANPSLGGFHESVSLAVQSIEVE